MMKLNIIAIICSFLVTGLAQAECTSNMGKKEMKKCQEFEKSGANYQEWKRERQRMADQSTSSPITGKDVRSMAPAAGKHMRDSKGTK